MAVPGFGGPDQSPWDGSIPLFTMEGSASCDFYGADGQLIADIPYLTDSEITASASVGLPNVSGTMSATLPALTLTSSGKPPGQILASLPALTIEMKRGGWINEELPAPTSLLSGKVERIGRISATLPTLEITARAGNRLSGNLPRITATISALVSQVGTFSLRLPALTLDARGTAPVVGSVTATLPKIQMEAEGSRPSSASLSGALPLPTLEISALSGVLGSINQQIPLFEIDATGRIEASGSLSGTLPALAMLGRAPADTVIIYSDTSRTTVNGYAICLNADHGAVTEYFNYAFNSFAYFDGKFIGAKSSGLYELTGTTDDGTIIPATVRTSTSDFGSSLKKRAPSAYIGLSSEGTIEMRVITDRGEENDAISLLSDTDDMATQKIKIGRGIKSRYWALELTNPDGSGFYLDSMELEPEVSSRKL